MSITVRKENQNRPVASPAPAPGTASLAASEWEPLRMMRSLLNWDPFREMAPFLSEERYGFAPAFEIKETKDAFVFKADLPGVKEQDLEVTISGNRLNVSGKRESEKEDKGDRYYTYERSYGSFTRSFTLPEGIDGDRIHAALDNGVLTLNVPKKPETQAKKIYVKAGGPPPAAKA